MTKKTKTILASAALAALVSGASLSLTGCHTTNPGGEAPSQMGKHACKGHNACKGQGGCKSGDNGCAGKNSCKGKGGCASKG